MSSKKMSSNWIEVYLQRSSAEQNLIPSPFALTVFTLIVNIKHNRRKQYQPLDHSLVGQLGATHSSQ